MCVCVLQITGNLIADKCCKNMCRCTVRTTFLEHAGSLLSSWVIEDVYNNIYIYIYSFWHVVDGYNYVCMGLFCEGWILLKLMWKKLCFMVVPCFYVVMLLCFQMWRSLHLGSRSYSLGRVCQYLFFPFVWVHVVNSSTNTHMSTQTRDVCVGLRTKWLPWFESGQQTCG